MEKDFKVVVATADRNDCSVITWYECKGKYVIYNVSNFNVMGN
jgi:hypothetical protein